MHDSRLGCCARRRTARDTHRRQLPLAAGTCTIPCLGSRLGCGIPSGVAPLRIRKDDSSRRRAPCACATGHGPRSLRRRDVRNVGDCAKRGSNRGKGGGDEGGEGEREVGMEIGRAGEREREGGGRREIECVREREKVLVCEGELYPRGGSRGRKGGERERE